MRRRFLPLTVSFFLPHSRRSLQRAAVRDLDGRRVEDFTAPAEMLMAGCGAANELRSNPRSRTLVAVTLVALGVLSSTSTNAQGLTVSVTSNKSYPLVGGTSVTWTATVSGASGPFEYKFYLYQRTAWFLMQDYGPSNTLTWTPQASDAGSPNYIQVWVRAVGSTAAYDGYGGTPSFEVLPPPIVLTASVDFPTPVGNTVTWTASTSQTTTPEYEFRVLDQTTSIWTVFRPYGTVAQAQWTPQANGTYVIEVRARAVGNTSEYQWAASSPTLTVASTTLTVRSLGTSTVFPAPTGVPITWTARVQGGLAGPLQYQFWRYSVQSGTWTNVQPYGPSETYTWTPTWSEQGEYSLQVWVRNAGSTAAYDAWRSTTTTFQIYPASLPSDMSAGCGAQPGLLVYGQNWANGVAPTAMPNTYYQNTSWGGSNPVDPTYPEIASSNHVTVLNGGGTSGENVLDLSGTDYSTAGLVFGGFGPIPDPSGDPHRNWWDATAGCVSVSYKWTTAAWNQAIYAPLIVASSDLYGSDGFSLHAAVSDWNTGHSQGTFDFLYPVCGPTTWGTQELNTAPFTRAATENQWQAFEVRWKNGTTDDIGSTFASDGWIRVLWNGTVIYNVENIALCLNESQQPATSGKPNRLRTVWLGYYGLFGPSTNLQVVDTGVPATSPTPTNNPPPSPPASFGTASYYHTDAIGSVRMVSDANQQVTRHDYLPFGQENPPSQDFRLFGGKEHDLATGFDYFGARYYANQSGRFTTADPALDIDNALVDPQRWNRYSYVRNNPLRYVDPDGRAIETVWDLISLGFSAKAVWQDPTSGWNWVSLGADVVSVLTPALPAIGMAIRGGSKIDAAVDAARAVEHAKEAADAATAARVIGKYPEYLELAEQIGAKRFNIPEQIWERMSDAERLAANNKFLDRGILRHDAFRSTERISDVLKTKGFSWLHHEVEYLLNAGYRVAEDGYTLIPR